jgi:ADP-ribosylglycohydrolase
MFTLARAARQVSDVTHYDPTGYTGDACVIWSILIAIAVHQGAANFDLGQACQDAVMGYIPQARQAFWADLIAAELGNPAIPAGKNGSAVGAFKVALNAVAQTENYADAIQRAIEAGHDTDTTAAIAGMLAGALYGMSGIPASYRDIVRGKAGPFPGYLLAGDLADLALCTANGWAFNVPEYATEYPVYAKR